MQTRIAIICWMQDSHSFEKSHSSTTKPNTIPVNFSKAAPQLCPRQDFTFQSSHSGIRHFLFKLRLTRDSFIFILIPGQKTSLSYYQNMTMRINLPCKNSLVAYMVFIVSWMICIQPLRSSLELAWTSTISGSFTPILIRNKPFSSWATSRTINFFREITVDFWSFRWKEKGEEGEQY